MCLKNITLLVENPHDGLSQLNPEYYTMKQSLEPILNLVKGCIKF